MCIKSVFKFLNRNTKMKLKVNCSLKYMKLWFVPDLCGEKLKAYHFNQYMTVS